jgi:hypothetical protein
MALSTKSLMLTHKTGLNTEVLAAKLEGKVIKGGMYHALDNGKLRYGLNSGTFFEFASVQDILDATFAFETLDSDTVQLSFIANKLKADARIDAALDNAISKTSAGLYVKKLTVDPLSIGYLSIDANNRIKLEKQATVEVHMVPTELTLAAFVSNVLSTLQVGSGDYIYLRDATDNKQKGWVATVNNPTTVAQFIPIEFPDYNDVQIRALFGAGDGIVYNPSTGIFSAKISTDASNDLSFGVDKGLYLNAAASIVSITNGSTVSDFSIEGALNALFGRTRLDASNGVVMETVGTGAEAYRNFKLGGALDQDTNIAGNGKQFSLNGLSSFAVTSGSSVSMIASDFLDFETTGGATMHLNDTKLEVNRDLYLNGGHLILSPNRGVRAVSEDGTVWLGKISNAGQWEFEPNS